MVVSSDKEAELQQENSDILTQCFTAQSENMMLRGKQKHCLKLGNIKIEVIPSANSNTTDVLKAFTKFAKEMEKLHGNAHLTAPAESANEMMLDAMVG
jgi:hypothetical protein|tara:strand:+ start:1732 stop:2025 length:294 start_codon:yes stop_codon:yes gene_type:complete